jgi:hypothetical protein
MPQGTELAIASDFLCLGDLIGFGSVGLRVMLRHSQKRPAAQASQCKYRAFHHRSPRKNAKPSEPYHSSGFRAHDK